MDLHLRYMAGAFHQLAIPPVANAEDIAHFEQCFSDAIELNATVQAAFKNYGTFMNQARELVIESRQEAGRWFESGLWEYHVHR